MNLKETNEKKLHKPQPSMADIETINGLPPLTKEQKEGIAIAAYICRMYGNGNIWAETIETHGEQQRARYWMKKEENELK